MMKALVYQGPGKRAWEEVPAATVRDPTDAVVGVDAVTICGTDLHILRGDVREAVEGGILGHEAVGTVTATGSAVQNSRWVSVCWCPALPPVAVAATAAAAVTGNASGMAAGSWAT